MEHQEAMLAKAVKVQRSHDLARLTDESHQLKTVFPLDSFVLAKPEAGPVDKLAPRWLGPYKVVQKFERPEGDIYRCLHLSTNQEYDFRVDRLDPYYSFDESGVRAAADLDNEAYEVETVLQHRFAGAAKTKQTLQLYIKWLGYEAPTWQPYIGNDLDKVGICHEYLRRHGMSKFIAARYQ
jgi:hypothetical protein